MRIAILSNPRSGRNRAASLASGCVSAIARRGHTPVPLTIADPLDASIDRLIVVGGDGTVHHTLGQLVELRIPFVHLPTGTANLIATEFGMPRRPEESAEWAIRGGTREIDIPTLDDGPFMIMVSAGADASVIHRFEQTRSGSGGYLNYVAPVIREVIAPRPARLSFVCDGEPIDPPRPVNLTIANLKSYALGINHCARADPSDQLLDVRATPCRSTIGWTIASLRARLRSNAPSSVFRRGARVEITARDACVLQVDGEIARTPTMPDGVLEAGRTILVEHTGTRIPVIERPHETG